MKKELQTREEFYLEIEGRINKTNNNFFFRRKNCIGSALFWALERKQDGVVWRRTNKVLSKLVKANEFKLGYLVGWKSVENKTYHLALVVNEDPLLFATRNGTSNQFSKNSPFDYVDEIYSKSKYQKKELNIYVPSKLQRILDLEKL